MLNSKGASLRLECSLTWIRKLVDKGKLQAYIYNDEGTLEKYEQGMPHQGQGMYFYEEDVKAFSEKRAPAGRPQGAHDKVADNPNRRWKRNATAH
jgi:hypothetical protein